MRTINTHFRLSPWFSITIAFALLATFATGAAAQSNDFYTQWLLIHGAPHVLDDVRLYPEQQRLAGQERQQQALKDFSDQLRWQQQRQDFDRRMEHWRLMNELQRQDRAFDNLRSAPARMPSTPRSSRPVSALAAPAADVSGTTCSSCAPDWRTPRDKEITALEHQIAALQQRLDALRAEKR